MKTKVSNAAIVNMTGKDSDTQRLVKANPMQ